jgi:prepilin-type N-terminal cleavage/methylation domain-containing protein
MHKRFATSGGQQGFTLIEIMAVLVIIGVLASVAIKKYMYIGEAANLKAIEAGVTELNSRETLTWTDQMFSSGGYQSDNAVWTAMSADTFLGPEYSWSGAPSETGGTLVFAGQSAALTRTSSDSTTPAKWRM